jgi:hypothetical protein
MELACMLLYPMHVCIPGPLIGLLLITPFRYNKVAYVGAWIACKVLTFPTMQLLHSFLLKGAHAHN